MSDTTTPITAPRTCGHVVKPMTPCDVCNPVGTEDDFAARAAQKLHPGSGEPHYGESCEGRDERTARIIREEAAPLLAQLDALTREKQVALDWLRQATNTKYPDAPAELWALAKVAADMLKVAHDGLHDADRVHREQRKEITQLREQITRLEDDVTLLGGVAQNRLERCEMLEEENRRLEDEKRRLADDCAIESLAMTIQRVMCGYEGEPGRIREREVLTILRKHFANTDGELRVEPPCDSAGNPSSSALAPEDEPERRHCAVDAREISGGPKREPVTADSKGQPSTDEASRATCDDCGREYGNEHGFPDLVVTYAAWKVISPTGDDGGLLCPSCICGRLASLGIRSEGAFMSGPIISVSETVMNTLRRVENIELAIEGRDNRWSGVRELLRSNDAEPPCGNSTRAVGTAHPEAAPCRVSLGGPSALHSALAEAGELDAHIAERHPEYREPAPESVKPVECPACGHPSPHALYRGGMCEYGQCRCHVKFRDRALQMIARAVTSAREDEKENWREARMNGQAMQFASFSSVSPTPRCK